MKNIALFFKNYFPTSGKKLLLFIFIFNFATYNIWRDWRSDNRTPFVSDADQYYSYLVGAFIHHDLSFSFHNEYWLATAPNGGTVPKVSMGLAMMMAPFFGIAHLVALASNKIADGYSSPYAYGIYYSVILIVFLGLFYLRKILKRYFTELVSNLTIVSIYFGTNLFYYTLGWNTLPHAYLFTLFVLFLYFTIRWYETLKLKYLIFLSLVYGLSVLIRPTEIVIIFIPLLYGVKSVNELKERFVFLWNKKLHLILAAIFFFLPWIPQMAFWKFYTDHYLFYSYGDEGFYFSNPQFYNVLLGFRKGWLIYTPIMVFSLLGFITFKKRCPDLFWGILIVFLITFYLISAWWAWWWGGCFGMRALIQIYAFLAFPMATFYSFVLEKMRKNVLIGILSVLVFYNLYQTYRYRATVIHWDSMTKEAFWWGIFKVHMSDEDKITIKPLLDPPDYSKRGE